MNLQKQKNADYLPEEEWQNVVKLFSDSTLMQCLLWAGPKRAQQKFSPIIVKNEEDKIVSAALVKITKIPFLETGLASVVGGPLWRPYNGLASIENFRRIIRELKHEYAEKRGFYLRVEPNALDERIQHLYDILKEEKFHPCHLNNHPYHTISIDLPRSINEFREGLKRQWRQNLDRSKKNQLEVVQGNNTDLFEIVERVYYEMRARKKFRYDHNIGNYSYCQDKLDPNLKYTVFICKYGGKAVSVLVISSVGDTAIAHVAGTTTEGLELRSSYYLWWTVLEWLITKGYRWFDTGGFDAVKSKGLCQFKAGLAGKYGKILTFHEFGYCDNLWNQLLVTRAYRLKHIFN